MNVKQKIYDSREKTNSLMKIENNYFHYLNLEKIRKRKPVFCSPGKISHNSKISTNDYYIEQENRIVNNILRKIREKPVKPKINSNMAAKEMHDDIRKKYQEMKKQKIDQENAIYKKRILSQKPFLCVKSMDLDYERSKILKNKKLESEDVVLPPIWINPRDYNKKRNNTEVKLDNDNKSSSIGGGSQSVRTKERTSNQSKCDKEERKEISKTQQNEIKEDNIPED